MNIITDDIDWAAYERETEEKAKVRPASAYLDAMMDELGRPEFDERKSYLPWEKTHGVFAFRGGEVTLWAGQNGHGKSMVSGMVGTSLISQSEGVCVASFEMKPRKTLQRMVTQFMGTGDEARSPEEIEMVRELYSQYRGLCEKKLWLYDQQGTVTTKKILAVTRYSFKELGVKHMFIDSLMKCVKGEDDYNGQKELVDELTSLARDYDAHVHLIHHLRKPAKETDQPDKSDVKGSGAIVDQVDNLMLVWRNKTKEFDLQAGKRVDAGEPDTVVFCRKQRNGTGWEGAIKLWFDPVSKQYAGDPNRSVDMWAWPHREVPV